MEQSKSDGGAEECHSSESGWTMYIGSTVDDYDEEVDDIVDYNDRTTTTPQADVEDDESDDSMASDASSGPSHHHYGNPWENIEGGYTAMAEDKEHDDKFFFEKNGASVKQITERKEEDDKGKAPDQDDDKVRRNFRMGN
ncbi:hypothetical protein K1719_011378 [Acacia pycnantha]|nr:hypothetical protein K1719_011378 [Acacia pycnantha]